MICLCLFTDANFMDEVELSHEENKMKILCERALLSLQLIQDKPGIWDIFITKYVDVKRSSFCLKAVSVIYKNVLTGLCTVIKNVIGTYNSATVAIVDFCG